MIRSRTSTTAPTSTRSPVSSAASRAVAACSVSPTSTIPPGRLHSPASGSKRRRISTTPHDPGTAGQSSRTCRATSSTKITAPTPRTGRSGYSRLLTHDLDDNALAAAAVELRVEHLLPGTEIERAVGDGQDHLVPQDGALQVRVGIVLAGLVMLVRQPRRRELLEPRLEVLDQSVLPVVDVDARRDVH